MAQKSRSEKREIRHIRIRKDIHGTAERPRLSVYRSLNHIYAQVIDDDKGVTLCSASSAEKNNKINGGNIEAAKVVGQRIAERAISNGVKSVVFDRGGYRYHGRVANLANAAREKGLAF